MQLVALVLALITHVTALRVAPCTLQTRCRHPAPRLDAGGGWFSKLNALFEDDVETPESRAAIEEVCRPIRGRYECPLPSQGPYTLKIWDGECI